MMGSGKVQVFYVKERAGAERLIKGTRKQVETMLFNEMTIAPAGAEDAHRLAATEIESAEGQP